MGKTSKRKQEVRLGGEVIRGLTSSIEAAWKIAGEAVELAEWCIQALDGEIEMSPQERHDYRTAAAQLRHALQDVEQRMAALRVLPSKDRP